MDGESGETTEEDDVTAAGRGKSERETEMRLMVRSEELIAYCISVASYGRPA